MDKGNYLNIDDLRKVWNNEFLPSIKREIKVEMESLRTAIKTLTARVDSIESSQSFISAKYDSVAGLLQTVNKASDALGKKLVEVTKTTDNMQTELSTMTDENDRQQQSLYRIDSSIDEMQQYSRRDCLEITGVPVLPDDNPKQLVKEIGSLIGVEIDDSHIGAAHRLPDTKKVKHRMIVKFVYRDVREQVYKKRRNLSGKNTSHLPSVQATTDHTAANNSKIHINESLTSYRKRLFGRINEFKRKNNYKYLWTANGKILLKANESSRTEVFVTHEEFEDYLDQIRNS